MVTQPPLDREAELDALEAHVKDALLRAQRLGASVAEVHARAGLLPGADPALGGTPVRALSGRAFGTPAFLPVATQASVKALTQAELSALGALPSVV